MESYAVFVTQNRVAGINWDSGSQEALKKHTEE